MLAALLFVIFSLPSFALALTQAYCSSQNTASGSAVLSTFQSNGLCHDKCQNDGWALAVVQDKSCWCSNYIPADQHPITSCDLSCPGFPAENCGSVDNGLFGYIALSKSPSGTRGVAGSTQKVAYGFSGVRTQTVIDAVEVDQTITSDDAATQAPSSSQAPKAPSGTTPVVSVQVITVSGSAVTQTVTSTPSSGQALQKTHSSKPATGIIVAATIGSILGLLALAVLVFFLRRMRKRAQQTGGGYESSSGGLMNRNTSVHSKSGLLASASSVPRLTVRGVDSSPSSGSPVDPMAERRHSRPMFFDSRLDPNALLAHDNGSRTSVRTIEDSRDYTRPLKITIDRVCFVYTFSVFMGL
ncbi:hypothetical protein EJ06DRAFT_521476 [Trichodelitschia bisporula]|uniref:WSC domain-containing protein n=1 Tax=Trichodelitschia bisporula TaxID=703511 RepID=A0A6G1HXJ8_9PEZI|nr:hypothetical protein EJ06DRAFT_521476 [Trichodelitschia bisporula]